MMVHMRDMRAEETNTRHERYERHDRLTKTKRETHIVQHSVLAGHKTNDKGDCSQYKQSTNKARTAPPENTAAPSDREIESQEEKSDPDIITLENDIETLRN